jgi:aspartate racemase
VHISRDRLGLTNPDKGGQTYCSSGSTPTTSTSPPNDFNGIQNRQRPSYRRIGILGGIGPESTMIYYQYIVREHHRQHGNLQYPEVLILSANYQDYEACLCQGQWKVIITKVTQALKSLQKAGAHYGLIACNTLHVVFDEIQDQSPIPLISIVEATIESIEQKGMKTVGLLGTCLTMNSGVYRENLETRGIETLVPSEEDRRFVDEVIRKELVLGVIKAKSRRRFVRIIDEMSSLGAEGVILGCTEIPLLISQRDCQIQLFDTALIHAQKALAYASSLRSN